MGGGVLFNDLANKEQKVLRQRAGGETTVKGRELGWALIYLQCEVPQEKSFRHLSATETPPGVRTEIENAHTTRVDSRFFSIYISLSAEESQLALAPLS